MTSLAERLSNLKRLSDVLLEEGALGREDGTPALSPGYKLHLEGFSCNWLKEMKMVSKKRFTCAFADTDLV